MNPNSKHWLAVETSRALFVKYASVEHSLGLNAKESNSRCKLHGFLFHGGNIARSRELTLVLSRLFATDCIYIYIYIYNAHEACAPPVPTLDLCLKIHLSRKSPDGQKIVSMIRSMFLQTCYDLRFDCRVVD